MLTPKECFLIHLSTYVSFSLLAGCGSGVQGIAALQRGASSVTFSDVNPRALRFVRFNLALNALSSKQYRRVTVTRGIATGR